MKTTMQKFTIILFPDEDGYTVIVPYYPEVTTWGKTPEEAFEMAQECLELVLEVHAETHRDQVLPGMDASHVVVGTIDAEVPDVLLDDVREHEHGKGKAMAMAMAEDEELRPGTLRRIQKQMGVSSEEFDRAVNELL